jgi:dTDP-4-amino-4,6-dideoxygalactose transaminase
MNRISGLSFPQISVLDLSLQYKAIREEIREAIDKVLDSQHFILGPQVEGLEREVAEYCGSCYGVGVASGTDALMLALRASGVGQGDEVLVPSFSFIATADTVSMLGATPVFVDILPDTFCMDPAGLEAKITPKAKAVVPVHLYGQSAEMDEIVAIARRHGLMVIEDNAQSIGAQYHGKRTGTMGDFGCLSFFPSKNLGAYGDGGMVLTNTPKAASRVRSLRAHGTTKKYFSVEQGWNSRLDELQAAILRVKLRHLDSWSEGRRSRAQFYDSLLAGVKGVIRPRVGENRDHVYHQYTVRVANRDKVQRLMRDNHFVPSTVYYPVPIHLQPIYAHLGYKPGDLPETERAAAEALSLPIYPEMTKEQATCVVVALEHSLTNC